MKNFNKVIFVVLTLFGLFTIVYTTTIYLKLSKASITIKYFKPHEYTIWEDCMNDSNMRDIYKPSGFFMHHNYISRNKYTVKLCTENKCMDCWYVRINEHIHNSEYYFDTVTPITFNRSLCEKLAQKIIRDNNLTWDKTHKKGELEEKCLYHKFFK